MAALLALCVTAECKASAINVHFPQLALSQSDVSRCEQSYMLQIAVPEKGVEIAKRYCKYRQILLGACVFFWGGTTCARVVDASLVREIYIFFIYFPQRARCCAQHNYSFRRMHGLAHACYSTLGHPNV